MAQSRGWRAVLLTDCYGQEPGTIKLRGPGGHWMLVFGLRSGILLDPGLARCWERGGSVRFDSPGGRSCGVLVPCAGRGVRGKVLALFSFYAPVSGPAFDAERRSALNELSTLLSSCPVRAVLLLGGDFNAEVGFKGVGDEGCLGDHAHGRRNRSGHQVVEWAKGEALLFLETFHHQEDRDTWYHPHDRRGHPLDHVLCRSRDLRFLGAVKVLHEDVVRGSGSPTWSAYTDHNPVEVRLAKGWVFRQPPRLMGKRKRPHWALLRGVGDGPRLAKEALATELSRRMAEEQPTSWSDLSGLGLDVSLAVLGTEPRRDSRPWVLGVEAELKQHDDAVAQASSRKRLAADDASWGDADKEWRRTKRRRSAWLRDREVAWWDAQAQKVQDASDQGDSFGVFSTFRELRSRGSSVRAGEVRPQNVEEERAAWANHFAAIGAGEGEVAVRVWDNVPELTAMDSVLGSAPAPNELHAALRQMSLGKAAGSDEVTAELLKFGGDSFWEAVVRVCREQWLLLTEAAPGEVVSWPAEWCVGLVVPLWKKKGSRKEKGNWRGITLLSVGSKLLARVVATRLRSFYDCHLGHHQFGFRQGRGVDDALQVTRRLVEEVATSLDTSAGIELSFHDIEKAYPRVCRTALWTLLERWGCDLSLLKVLKMLHGGTSYKVRVHGGLSAPFIMERGLREGCPSSPVLFNIYHAAVMMDFRARRAQAANEGLMDAGVSWVSQVDGRIFHPRFRP